MSSKPNQESNTSTTNKPEKRGTVICGVRGPGPKYLLRTVVGYKEHCLSKLRNPAYSFGIRHLTRQICLGPGPKYLVVEPKRGGFSFGLATKKFDTSCSPGPKYILPTPKSPAFTIKSRTKHRQQCLAPGPYYVKPPKPTPAFYIGQRLPKGKCDGTPGPRPYSVELVKPRAPIYSLSSRFGGKAICRSPGPKYHPKLEPPMPQYSFGTKHSECAPPYIVECDEQC